MKKNRFAMTNYLFSPRVNTSHMLCSLLILCCGLICGITPSLGAWGRAGHEIIVKWALIPDLFPQNSLFLKNKKYILKNCMKADLRKKWVSSEGMKHYINPGSYGITLKELLKKSYDQLKNEFGFRAMKKNGTLPWAIIYTRKQILKALIRGNKQRALKLASDLAHYIGDVSQPLHVTRFYDGKTREAKGLHSRYETTVFMKVVSHLVRNSFLPKYIDNSLSEIRPIIESGQKSNRFIFMLDNRLRKLDPGCGTRYSNLMAQELTNSYEKRVQAGAELLANFLYSIEVDFKK